MKYPTPGVTYPEGTQLTIGPFLFERRDSDTQECWDVVFDPDLRCTHFSLKNYGGKPTETWAFSGWRIVSSGPFGDGFSTREEAFEKGVPWLIEYYRKEACERAAKAMRQVQLLEELFKKVDTVTT